MEGKIITPREGAHPNIGNKNRPELHLRDNSDVEYRKIPTFGDFSQKWGVPTFIFRAVNTSAQFDKSP